jgi:phosphatidylglycerophosphatase A
MTTNSGNIANGNTGRTWWAWTTGTFFGIGLIKPGPGTWGSAAAMLLWMVYANLTHVGSNMLSVATLIAAAVALAIGIPAANIVARESGVGDPQMVVIDEAVGQWITLLLVPADWGHAILALLFFRLFDIVKPPPARQFDRMHGGFGIMMDDVAAGVYAFICMQLVHIFY